MVSVKGQLLATILLISEVYSQRAGCGCPQPCQRGAPAAPSMIPGGCFMVPAIIKPLIPTCKPEVPTQFVPRKQGSVCSCPPASCVDDLDDSELDKLIYLLISNILESKKGFGKKQSCTSNLYDINAGSSACSCDAYDACACSYADDYDYCSCSAPPVYSSSTSGGGDGYCPEISLFIKHYND